MNNNLVYINKLSKFLPNSPVKNEEMGDFLGLIKGQKSKSQNIVLRNNGIKTRYYAIDKEGKPTHTNYELASEAIKKLTGDDFAIEDIDLLACGTGSPDQMLPSHASMVHGDLGCNPVEIISPAGSCNSGMLALKYAYISVLAGFSKNAVSSGSEKASSWLQSKNFDEEMTILEELGKNPYLSFEKDFLRWMLSDGAGAALLQPKPNNGSSSLKIDWIETVSFANEAKTCMSAGGMYEENGALTPWRDLTQSEQMKNSVFSIRQNSKLLEKYVTKLGAKFLKEIAENKNFTPSEVDYFLPHMSSEFFRKVIIKDLAAENVSIPEEKWFTNLNRVGNVGSASVFLMLEELFNSGELKPGNKILAMVPESARFSYSYMHLTVV